MRILVVHNFYQDPGGEDEVFRLEKAMLSETEEVFELTFSNKKGWAGWIQFLLYPYNFIAMRRIKAAIKQFKPDLVHIHNLHYAIGPAGIKAVKKFKIPLVMTLHNFRLICPSATLFNNGNVFLDSVKSDFPWKAVKLGLFSNSIIKTFWLAFANWAHKKMGTYNLVDQYIVLTDFARKIYLSSTLNISEQKFSLKPNFIFKLDFPNKPKQDYFLYVGRLSEEKGIRIALNAALKGDFKLSIAGDGPLKNELLSAAAQNKNIVLLGALSKNEVLSQMSSCSALVFPSICFEGMPMSIIEAFACATPVIASNLGAMQTMITDGENGLFFNPGDVDSLLGNIAKFSSLTQQSKLQMGANAKLAYESSYTEKENKNILMQIYSKAMQ
ncbi:glycosyltransferase family 1 protein [Pedobacter changchengzhani]|uniref:Glycosyltransferase family 1 protein n=1 Tax=Pedobacter changchengzhani TaxID=2529274 RepID=A0A4R5MPF8_9SPHI|nr:glycosyltransferase family 4 protein [Pedobacter changchengzhani]TDG37215.1 glycosyltransferase family 1 protein [Pedobacter changchengzhani]